MRKLIVLTIVAALSAAAHAENPVGYKDSIDFDFVWEMETSPTASGDFNPHHTPTIVAGTTPTDGYYLELNPEEGTTQGDAILSDLSTGFWGTSGITESTGFTAEISVKVGEPKDETMIASGALLVGTTADERIWLTYGQDGLIWGASAGAPVIDENDNSDAFHTLRMVKEPDLNRVWVYRDGVLLNSEEPLTSNGGGAELCQLGCLGGTLIGTSYVDYLRVTPGAWAPVGSDLPPDRPEPSYPPTDGTQYFLDTFDTTADPAMINDELGVPRQSGPAMPVGGIAYVDQGSGTTSVTGGELLMSSTGGAQQASWLDQNFSDLAGTKYGISATCTFPETQSNTNEWAALILDETQHNDVVAGIDLSFLVRSTGWWRVYIDGAEVAGNGGVELLPADSYDVYLLIDEEAGTYNVWANDTQLVTDGAYTGDALPDRYVGVKYYAYGAGPTLTFDNLLIETFDGGETPIDGDLNGDGFVGSADLDIVRGAWGQSVTGAANGDPSGDGVVGSADLDIVRANWGNTATATAVPEPGTIVVLLIGGIGLGLIRRK